MWGFVHLLNSFWDSTAYLIYNVIYMYSPQMYAMMTWHYSSFCVKFIKWDFSHGSLYFCCTDESINFQKLILFQSWKFITIINQFFCGLINKYCCLLLSLSWHMRRKKPFTNMAYNGKNVGCEVILQTLLGTGLTQREISSWNLIQFNSEINIWPKKKQELS